MPPRRMPRVSEMPKRHPRKTKLKHNGDYLVVYSPEEWSEPAYKPLDGQLGFDTATEDYGYDHED